MSSKLDLKMDKLPAHIAIIMDGNGRWAKKKGNIRIFGHQNGVEAVRDTVEGAAEIGLKYLTLYAFSTENWNRPRTEVDALMQLLVSSLEKEKKTLMDNGVRLLAIGDLLSLNNNVRNKLQKVIDETSGNTGLKLTLALSYSGRWEIIKAIKNIAVDIQQNKLDVKDICDKTFNDYLDTQGYPEPELLIRTSGEHRISNFLLWQLAYTELYFTETLWPDFRRGDLYDAIVNFQSRERRFGKISEQICE